MLNNFHQKFYFCFMSIFFSNPSIQLATDTDLAIITDLLNSAYRGERSKAGWTHEEHLIDGEVRTTEATLYKLLHRQNSVLLKYINKENIIIGCVNLQQQQDGIYLGMLCVSPKLQGGGIGRQLLKAAEEYGALLNCFSIYMTVISVRSELIDWYKRHGYHDTGERIPFNEDGISGKHLQPLKFMVLKKILK
jgi:ribosomal protein S18 acetylase RimI-like enzyme